MRNLSVLASLLLASATPVHGQQPKPPASSHPPEWTEAIPPFRIAGPLYYVGSRDLAAYLIDGGDGLILLDAGLPEFAPQLLSNIRTLGFDPMRIKLLLNSQAHFDHAGGLAAIKSATGARLLASRPDAALLDRGGKGDFQWGDTLPYPRVKVDGFIRDGEKIRVGTAVMTAHLNPGHSKGCTTWTMPVRVAGKQRVAQFVCGTSAPGYRLVANPGYPMIVRDFRRSFAKLRTIPCDIFLGAHGSYFALDAKRAMLAAGRDGNPFVDPAGCRDHVDRAERRFLDQLAAEQQARGVVSK